MLSYGFRTPSGVFYLRYMKRFYELYPNTENLPQAVDNSSQPQNRPQAVDDSEQLVFCIPWGHNRTIIDKCRDNPAKALFFVKETIENKRRLSDRAGTAFEHKKAPDFLRGC